MKQRVGGLGCLGREDLMVALVRNLKKKRKGYLILIVAVSN